MRTYSRIHSIMVDDEADIVGHVAYSLYKKEKASFIERERKKGPTKPTENEIERFTNSIASSKNQIDGYKIRAQKILDNYNSLVAEKAILEHYRKEHTWLYGFFQSFISAIAFAALTGIIIFIITFSGHKLAFVPVPKDNSQNEAQSSQQQTTDEPTYILDVK